MIYSDFNENVFKESIRKAQKSVRRVLDIDRTPNLRLAGEVDHGYMDKYKLANLLTNVAIISIFIVLEKLGLTKEVLQRIDKDASKEKTIRIRSHRKCSFVNEESLDIPFPMVKETKKTKNSSNDVGIESTITTIAKRITREHYIVKIGWEVSIFSGTDIENREIINERTNAMFDYTRDIPSNVNKSKNQEPPFPAEEDIYPPMDLSLTWLLQQIDTKDFKSLFSIDTSPSNTKTKTPRRNFQIESAIYFFRLAKEWTAQVYALFAIAYPDMIRSGNGQGDEKSLASNIEQIKTNDIFVPILPLLEDKKADGNDDFLVSAYERDKPESEHILSLPDDYGDGKGQECALVNGSDFARESPLLSNADITSLLNEQSRCLREVGKKLEMEFPNPVTSTKILSSAEAYVSALCLHVEQIVNQYIQSIDYIEHMLEQQLIAAIGKTVRKADLDKFMKYHNDKILNPSPKPFCHAIRRPEHFPDGIISIESTTGDAMESMEPIDTHVREVKSLPVVNVPLNAATTVALTGKTYLHGWLNHRFGDSFTELTHARLKARARQFSSFVLMVGTMMGDNRMQPKDAIILRNKDEIHIPLLLNEIPTATEFKDAISSLSPEQQRFAKAFRSMQLESSVLGVCVIQIKPQLEKLLGLPSDSLTKEIKLTEDLMELFVEYQVPSDLVSYDGDWVSVSHTTNEKVSTVKEHVKGVLSVIEKQKKEQLEEAELKAKMAVHRHTEAAPEACFASQGRVLYRMKKPGRGDIKRRLTKQQPPGLLRAMAAAPSSMATPPVPLSMTSNGVSGESMCVEYDAERCFVSDEEDMCSDVDNWAIEDRSDYVGALNDGFQHDDGKTNQRGCNDDNNVSEKGTADFTSIPKILDQAIEMNDKDASIRSTTIQLARDGWVRHRQENLLAKVATSTLSQVQIESETNKAFDLLDALSRSGSLDISFCELHVLICATHHFEKNIMETAIQDNINPIEKLEMSTLLMGSTIMDVPAEKLVRNEKKRKQLAETFPLLIHNGESK